MLLPKAHHINNWLVRTANSYACQDSHSLMHSNLQSCVPYLKISKKTPVSDDKRSLRIMADVLGVVASGVGIGSLAIQIASSVQQILDFWSSVKDAPEGIRRLLDELRLLAEVLSTIDDVRDDHSSSAEQTATRKAIQYCHNAAREVDAVVKDIAGGLATSKSWKHRAAVKFVLKDKRITKDLQRLDRAKSMLLLVQQCYTKYSYARTGLFSKLMYNLTYAGHKLAP